MDGNHTAHTVFLSSIGNESIRVAGRGVFKNR
jgi:hypothetical protein